MCCTANTLYLAMRQLIEILHDDLLLKVSSNADIKDQFHLKNCIF